MGDLIEMRKLETNRARAEAVIGILIDWARWQQGYAPRLGYPPKSCGLQSGNQSASSDDWSAAEDRRRNEIVDRCIDDLETPAHKAAIHHRYLAAVFRMRDYEDSLAEAHVILMDVFQVKGVLW